MKIDYKVLSAGATIDGEDSISSARLVPADNSQALGVIDIQVKNAVEGFEAGSIVSVSFETTKSFATVKSDTAATLTRSEG